MASSDVPLVPSGQPASSAASRCPKCGADLASAVASGASHCPKCGLARAKMASYVASGPADVPEVRDAWAQLVAAWSDGPRHGKFVELARTMGALPLAARLYRQYRDAHPGDQAASLQLERVVKLVQVDMSTVVAARVAPEPTPYKKAVTLLIVLVVMVVLGAGYLTFARSGARPHDPGAMMTPRQLQQQADQHRRELMRNGRQRPLSAPPTPPAPPATSGQTP